MSLNNPGLSKFRSLSNLASSSFFCLSYAPLFVLMIGKSVIFNYQNLHFAGFNLSGFKIFFRCFSIPVLCLAGVVWGITGSYFLLKNLEDRKPARVPVEIKAAENQGSEALTYLVSYALPLLQTSGNAWMDSLIFLVIISLYFGLYRNSKLVLVNPVLNLFYSLFQISFTRLDMQDKTKIYQGWAISKASTISEGDKLMALEIGNNLFYLNE